MEESEKGKNTNDFRFPLKKIPTMPTPVITPPLFSVHGSSSSSCSSEAEDELETSSDDSESEFEKASTSKKVLYEKQILVNAMEYGSEKVIADKLNNNASITPKNNHSNSGSSTKGSVSKYNNSKPQKAPNDTSNNINNNNFLAETGIAKEVITTQPIANNPPRHRQPQMGLSLKRQNSVANGPSTRSFSEDPSTNVQTQKVIQDNPHSSGCCLANCCRQC